MGSLALAIHGIEPRSYRRCRELRRWLRDRGVDRVTLLVVPAPDLHPIGSRSPALAAWLRERIASDDTVAQHGLAPRAPGAEFRGLDRTDAAARVATGLRLLRELELDPDGFVAPAYAYTAALRDVLHERFRWFADQRTVAVADGTAWRSPALQLDTPTPLRRALAHSSIGAARACGELMRIDVHPADVESPRRLATLAQLLVQARDRRPITYDELVRVAV
jgi:predicted deacetylase